MHSYPLPTTHQPIGRHASSVPKGKDPFPLLSASYASVCKWSFHFAIEQAQQREELQLEIIESKKLLCVVNAERLVTKMTKNVTSDFIKYFNHDKYFFDFVL